MNVFCIKTNLSAQQPHFWQAVYSLERCSGSVAKIPTILPHPLHCLPPHWQSTHIQNNPPAVIAINTKQNKTKNVYLVANSSSSEYSLAQGPMGVKRDRVSAWYSFKKSGKNLLKTKSVLISTLRPKCSFFGWKTTAAALSGVGSSTCLVDNYRLAWRWHYQYLGKLLPNYASRDRRLGSRTTCAVKTGNVLAR